MPHNQVKQWNNFLSQNMQLLRNCHFVRVLQLMVLGVCSARLVCHTLVSILCHLGASQSIAVSLNLIAHSHGVTSRASPIVQFTASVIFVWKVRNHIASSSKQIIYHDLQQHCWGLFVFRSMTLCA